MRTSYIISFILLVSIVAACRTQKQSDNYIRPLPKRLTQTKDKPNWYESQGEYHSTFIVLKNDSTFVFFSIYEVGYDFSMGSYNRKGSLITLNWSKKETLNAISDTSIYYQYYRHGTPEAYELDKIKYRISKNKTLIKR